MEMVEITAFDGSVGHAGVEREDGVEVNWHWRSALLELLLVRSGIAVAFDAPIATAATGGFLFVTFQMSHSINWKIWLDIARR